MPPPRRDLLAVLHPLTKALRRIEDEAAARADLTMWQYAILSVVAERAGRNQREVAKLLHYSANRIIADLDDLERRGFVEREPGADRRANVLSVTRAGASVQRRIQREIHRGEDELLAGLSAAQRRHLHVVAGAVAQELASLED